MLRAIVSAGRPILILAAAAAALAGPAHAADPRVLSIEVVLSPGAQRTLAKAGEAVTVAAAFYGDPSRDGRPHADEAGQIALLRSEQMLQAAGGIARFPLAAIPSAGLRWVAGPTRVNVNVYSARRHFRDNVLSCDFLDGVVPAPTRMPIRLRCGLIRESPRTRALS